MGSMKYNQTITHQVLTNFNTVDLFSFPSDPPFFFENNNDIFHVILERQILHSKNSFGMSKRKIVWKRKKFNKRVEIWQSLDRQKKVISKILPAFQVVCWRIQEVVCRGIHNQNDDGGFRLDQKLVMMAKDREGDLTRAGTKYFR